MVVELTWVEAPATLGEMVETELLLAGIAGGAGTGAGGAAGTGTVLGTGGTSRTSLVGLMLGFMFLLYHYFFRFGHGIPFGSRNEIRKFLNTLESRG